MSVISHMENFNYLQEYFLATEIIKWIKAFSSYITEYLCIDKHYIGYPIDKTKRQKHYTKTKISIVLL